MFDNPSGWKINLNPMHRMTTAAASGTIDSNAELNVSGDVLCYYFLCEETVASGTVDIGYYIFEIILSGSQNFEIEIWPALQSENLNIDFHKIAPDYTAGLPIASLTFAQSSDVDPKWYQKTLTVDAGKAGLEKGKPYVCLIYTLDGIVGGGQHFINHVKSGVVPPSNYGPAKLLSGYSTQGAKSNGDGQTLVGTGPWFIKYPSGLLSGNPYTSGVAVTNTTDYHGLRFNVPYPMYLCGFTTSALDVFENVSIYNGADLIQAGEVVLGQSVLGWQGNFSPSVLLVSGINYDVVWKNPYAAIGYGKTIKYAAIAADALDDVKNMQPSRKGTKWGYVTGAAAPFTFYDYRMPQITLIFDSGGGGLITHPGMGGGMRG